MAAKLLVMDLQPFHSATDLASPIIALEYLSAKFLILQGVQLQPRAFRAHGAFTHFGSARRERSAFYRRVGI